MGPNVGDRVLYTLNDGDAQVINTRRDHFQAFQDAVRAPLEPGGPAIEPGMPGATGHIAHVGNRAAAGQTFPADVVRVFGDVDPCVNLTVNLDGTDTYWTARGEGEGPGTWAWPFPHSAEDSGAVMPGELELAKAGYKAYGQTTGFLNYQGKPMPEWDELGGRIQAAWKAAAATVRDKVLSPPASA